MPLFRNKKVYAHFLYYREILQKLPYFWNLEIADIDHGIHQSSQILILWGSVRFIVSKIMFACLFLILLLKRSLCMSKI